MGTYVRQWGCDRRTHYSCVCDHHINTEELRAPNPHGELPCWGRSVEYRYRAAAGCREGMLMYRRDSWLHRMGGGVLRELTEYFALRYARRYALRKRDKKGYLGYWITKRQAASLAARIAAREYGRPGWGAAKYCSLYNLLRKGGVWITDSGRAHYRHYRNDLLEESNKVRGARLQAQHRRRVAREEASCLFAAQHSAEAKK